MFTDYQSVATKSELYLEKVAPYQETKRTRQDDELKQLEIKRAVRLHISSQAGKVSLIIGKKKIRMSVRRQIKNTT